MFKIQLTLLGSKDDYPKYILEDLDAKVNTEIIKRGIAEHDASADLLKACEKLAKEKVELQWDRDRLKAQGEMLRVVPQAIQGDLGLDFVMQQLRQVDRMDRHVSIRNTSKKGGGQSGDCHVFAEGLTTLIEVTTANSWTPSHRDKFFRDLEHGGGDAKVDGGIYICMKNVNRPIFEEEEVAGRSVVFITDVASQPFLICQAFERLQATMLARRQVKGEATTDVSPEIQAAIDKLHQLNAKARGPLTVSTAAVLANLQKTLTSMFQLVDDISAFTTIIAQPLKGPSATFKKKVTDLKHRIDTHAHHEQQNKDKQHKLS